MEETNMQFQIQLLKMRIKQTELVFDEAMQSDMEFQEVKKLYIEIKELKKQLERLDSEVKLGSNNLDYSNKQLS